MKPAGFSKTSIYAINMLQCTLS